MAHGVISAAGAWSERRSDQRSRYGISRIIYRRGAVPARPQVRPARRSSRCRQLAKGSRLRAAGMPQPKVKAAPQSMGFLAGRGARFWSDARVHESKANRLQQRRVRRSGAQL